MTQAQDVQESALPDDGAPAGETPADGSTVEADAAETTEEVSPLDAALADAAQFREKLLRTAADFDNFRKRSRRETVDAERKGRDNLLKDLLPVFDNLERAMSHAEKSSGNLENDWKGLSDGIGLVIRQFRDTLGRLGVERVASVGQPFDPGVHEAIQHMETTEFEPGHVAAEAQPGYRDGDRLVRPALVVVAKAPAPPAAAAPDEANPADESPAESIPDEGSQTE